MSHFSDQAHIDMCCAFNCLRMDTRDNMIRANKVPTRTNGPINKKSRGWLCRECAERRGWPPSLV